ncbi:retinol dehydrogenase 12 [Folsomia candida]|uniref:retinol dehydrogenase 12 n=1 Tax=Folsomia candida TaxID=158441 RepID=UPI0016053D9F|nr:retinol dehydrogenase 12 [Folsomia candida]
MYRLLPLRKFGEESVLGKVVIITGAGTGLGKYVAHEMVKRGAKVVMAVPDLAQGNAAKLDIIQQSHCDPDDLDLVHVNLSDLSSVRRFASTLTKRYSKIDILINNAGISLNSSHLTKTVDGFEEHMGVNHLGHFLLTNLLLPQLRRSESARVVMVSSTMMMYANLNLDDFMGRKGRGRGVLNVMPYSNSKMAMALFSKELANREKERIKCYACCPGIVKGTRIFEKYAGSVVEKFVNLVAISIPMGANTILYCALGHKTASKSGQFFRFEERFSSGEALLKDDYVKAVWNLSASLVECEESSKPDRGNV